ncbi:MAG: 30S ribosomal protein S16 [Aeriscardovia sp.]|nr:30S ribosomal protein S16 [Aeriscardovia sp.]MBP5785706.1 30S ribosomal protein S16 [Aeriscardovia sp.]MBQ1301489.1 30S ribosomal protein S16 [Aeriscardovia sp.]MBQ1357308.1 30S ribosomal protein S16 [Aeriscardovia sp.]MBQ1425036.1 30S ribosomal protein S16 [Aeriscardovia sp.]
MSTRIRLKRTGKIHDPQYRVVVVDQRKKRDGKVIEEVGYYNPNPNPSLIHIDSEKVQRWLAVGAQPSDPVLVLLKITGDWQKFKGLPGAEGTLKMPAQKVSAEKKVEEVSDEAQALKAKHAADEVGE